MTSPVWDPQQYLRFADERTRPLRELLGRVPELPAAPTVLDIGCGPGNSTAGIRRRWPDATITGIDSSAEMLATARGEQGEPSADYLLADAASYDPAPAAPDLIVSNATLQWIDGHLALLPRWAAALKPGGVIAFQVPGNFEAPSHLLLGELWRSARWRDRLGEDAPRAAVHQPEEYLAALLAAAARRTSGRPPTARCSPARTRSSSGRRGRHCARCSAGSPTTPSAPRSWPSTPPCCARPIRRGRTARSSRSAGSSRSASGSDPRPPGGYPSHSLNTPAPAPAWSAPPRRSAAARAARARRRRQRAAASRVAPVPGRAWSAPPAPAPARCRSRARAALVLPLRVVGREAEAERETARGLPDLPRLCAAIAGSTSRTAAQAAGRRSAPSAGS